MRASIADKYLIVGCLGNPPLVIVAQTIISG